MRKLNLIWDMKKKMTKPQQNTNVNAKTKKREIGKNERVSIDALDFF